MCVGIGYGVQLCQGVSSVSYWSAEYLGAGLVDFGLPLVLAWLGWKVIRAGVWGRKSARRLCAECGYDMRGSVGLKCPECGYTAKSEYEVEHGRVKRLWVLAGGLMILPIVWAVVFFGMAGLGLMIAQAPLAEVRGIDAKAGLLHGAEERGEEQRFYVDVHLRQPEEEDVTEVNAASRLAMLGLRWVMGDPTLGLKMTNKEDQAKLDLARRRQSYRDGSTRAFLAEESPAYFFSGGNADWLVTYQSFATARFLTQFWVNPIEHFRRYFETEGMPTPPGVGILVEGHNRDPKDRSNCAAMPDAVFKMIRDGEGIRVVVMKDVVCDDRVMKMLTEKDELFKLECKWVTASPGVVANFLKKAKGLKKVELWVVQRPVAEEELRALPEGHDAVMVWRGEATISDEGLAWYIAMPDELKPQLGGTLLPSGWKKSVAAAKGGGKVQTGRGWEPEIIYKRTGSAGEINDEELRTIAGSSLFCVYVNESGKRPYSLESEEYRRFGNLLAKGLVVISACREMSIWSVRDDVNYLRDLFSRGE